MLLASDQMLTSTLFEQAAAPGPSQVGQAAKAAAEEANMFAGRASRDVLLLLLWGCGQSRLTTVSAAAIPELPCSRPSTVRGSTFSVE